MDIALEFTKFRVPLSKAWEGVVSNLLNHPERDEVEARIKIEVERLDKVILGEGGVPSESDTDLVKRAREEVFALVQQRFSGSLPDLPDRETDNLTQHGSIWSLIGKFLQTRNKNSQFSKWCVEYSCSFLHQGLSDAADNYTWKSCGRNVLNAIHSLKGGIDERIVEICQSDEFLSDKELMTPSVKALIRSEQFKKLMTSPDMVTDGERTLPKLLLDLAGDRDFKKTFTWLPLDPYSPLTKSGGNGVMPTDKSDYRFIVSIILKILFGKLRQRGGGIDRRTSMAERQHQIMGYIGTIPMDEMDMVFKIFFSRIVNSNFEENLRNLSLKFNGTEFVNSQGIPILQKEILESNQKLQAGVLQSVHFMVHQMKRKIDDFVPLLIAIVVSLIKWSDSSNLRPSLARLNELMAAYSHMGSDEWLTFLSPISSELESSLERSSSSEVSSVFKLITSWCYSESLCPLYGTDLGKNLLQKLFVPARPLVDKPADLYLKLVLILAGVDPSLIGATSTSSKSYKQSRSDAMRANRRRGGEEDSESDTAEHDSGDDEVNQKPVFVENGLRIISQYLCEIISTISLSFSDGGAKNTLQLEATIALAKLASESQIVIPDESASQLLTLLASLIGPYSAKLNKQKTKKTGAKNLIVLLNAVTELVKVSAPHIVPKDLLISCSRLVATLDDVEGRLLLSQCIVEMVKKIDPEQVGPSQILVQLNAIRKTSVSVQPDIDSHVEVLQDLIDSKSAVDSMNLIRHCLFLISSSACDSTVRHCAERLLCAACRPDSSGIVPTVRVTMILNWIHRLIALHNTEGPLKSGIKVLIFLVREVSVISPKELADRLHVDLLPFVTIEVDEKSGVIVPSVIEDLLHIQKQKRTRALKKLIESTLFTEYTVTKLIVPLGLDAVIQPGVM